MAIGVGTLLAASALAPQPLAALSLRACGAAYKDAGRAGTLGGMSWQEFRKAKCGATASTGGGAKAKTGAQAGSSPAPDPEPAGSGYLPSGRMVLPSAIPPKYKGEMPGKARRQTCLDQYRLNKASDANGGLKWVEKGGGYFSACDKRLKAVRKR
jgi:hypothetical protein